MIIRPYEFSHSEAVWELHNVALRDTGAHIGNGPWDDDLKDIPAVYEQNQGRFLVGVLDGGQLSPWKDLDTLASEFGLESLVEDTGGHNSAWGSCLQTFLTAIEQDTVPPQDLFDSLHITAIGWAANESLISGVPAKVHQFD